MCDHIIFGQSAGVWSDQITLIDGLAATSASIHCCKLRPPN